MKKLEEVLNDVAELLIENNSLKTSLEQIEFENKKLKKQLQMSKRREMPLCGDHHGKGYAQAFSCVMCEMERKVIDERREAQEDLTYIKKNLKNNSIDNEYLVGKTLNKWHSKEKI